MHVHLYIYIYIYIWVSEWVCVSVIPCVRVCVCVCVCLIKDKEIQRSLDRVKRKANLRRILYPRVKFNAHAHLIYFRLQITPFFVSSEQQQSSLWRGNLVESRSVREVCITHIKRVSFRNVFMPSISRISFQTWPLIERRRELLPARKRTKRSRTLVAAVETPRW